MPTYEYVCKGCEQHLDVVQSFKDEPLTTCPACGGALRKVFGSIGIAFKGSGFYRTDSRRSSSDGPSKPAAKEASSKEASSKAAPDAPSSKSASGASSEGGSAGAASGKSAKSA